MKLVHCEIKGGNFGDDINTWIWNHLLGEKYFDNDEAVQFYGIGTILSDKLPDKPEKIIFGSGVGYPPPPIIDDTYRIFAVRGPLTAKKLNIDPSHALADSAYLLNLCDLPAEVKNNNKKYKVSIIPHHKSLDMADWDNICKELGFHLINPKDHYFTVLQQINQSEKVISESLHGAIFADIFRVPWLSMKFSFRFMQLKWEDWLHSILPAETNFDRYFYNPPFLLTNPAHSAGIRLEYFLKSKASIFNKNYKWSKSPYRISTLREQEKFNKSLKAAAENKSYFLSSDKQTDEITDRYREKIELLKHG